jgi:hypothetical protein
MVGPALFVAVFLIEGWLRPGYSPMSMYISALSLGPRGWIQIANFIVLGVALGVFTWGIAGVFPTGKASRWGVILMRVLAVLYAVSGPFVMDPMGTPQSAATVHGTIHGLAGGIVFLVMPVSMAVFLRRFRSDPPWHFLARWTLVLGVFDALAVLIFTVVSKSPGLLTAASGWIGLIQRVALVPFMVWLFGFGLGVLRRENGGDES